MAFLKILFYLIVLIVVLMLAYYTTRMLGRGMGRTRGTGGMEILDQMALGRDSYLLVVKVQERIFLIGVSPGRISKVEELESYDKKGETEGAPIQAFFLSLFQHKFLHGLLGPLKGLFPGNLPFPVRLVCLGVDRGNYRTHDK